MRNNIQQENNTTKPITYQLVLPLDVGVKIEADAPIRLLLEITERMDSCSALLSPFLLTFSLPLNLFLSYSQKKEAVLLFT